MLFCSYFSYEKTENCQHELYLALCQKMNLVFLFLLSLKTFFFYFSCHFSSQFCDRVLKFSYYTFRYNYYDAYVNLFIKSYPCCNVLQIETNKSRDLSLTVFVLIIPVPRTDAPTSLLVVRHYQSLLHWAFF